MGAQNREELISREVLYFPMHGGLGGTERLDNPSQAPSFPLCKLPLGVEDVGGLEDRNDESYC